MSAEKPEVGDVWENDGLILHIDKFSEDRYGKIIYCYDMDKKGYVAGCWYYLDIFLNNAKYLGKSKASIKDLFETVVMNGARGLLYDLLISHQFSDDDEGRILRCAADLSDCVKENAENFTQTDLHNIADMQAEIDRLRDLLKQCIPAAEFAKDKGLVNMINQALNGK